MEVLDDLKTINPSEISASLAKFKSRLKREDSINQPLLEEAINHAGKKEYGVTADYLSMLAEEEDKHALDFTILTGMTYQLANNPYESINYYKAAIAILGNDRPFLRSTLRYRIIGQEEKLKEIAYRSSSRFQEDFRERDFDDSDDRTLEENLKD